jgi:hypothetical protein
MDGLEDADYKEHADDAILAIQKPGDKSDASWFPIWKAAAAWTLKLSDNVVVNDYLEQFGFEAAQRKWLRKPKDCGMSFHLELKSSEQVAGHKWYQVECTIKRSGRGMTEIIQWTAPRLLAQMRADLHDRVKDTLGESYDGLFAQADFANHTPPSNTEVRLYSWLLRLSHLITNGDVSPGVAALALLFFQAPAAISALTDSPDDSMEPNMETSHKPKLRKSASGVSKVSNLSVPSEGKPLFHCRMKLLCRNR